MTDISFSQAEAVTPPGKGSGGARLCEVCGTELHYVPGHGRPPRFCDEHKPAGARNNSAATGGKGKGKGNKTKNNAATENEWNKFLSFMLLTGTYLIGRYAAGGHGIMLSAPAGMTDAELNGIAESLAMEFDEADPIAKLIAKKATPSSLNKRVGFVVTNFNELEEVGSALVGYGKRIAPILAMRVQGNPRPIATVQPLRPRRTARPQSQQPTTVRAETPDGTPGQAQPSNAEVQRVAIERLRTSTGNTTATD